MTVGILATTLVIAYGAITKLKVGLLLLKRAFLQASPSDFAKNTNLLVTGVNRLGRALRSTRADFVKFRNAMIQSASAGRATTGVFAIIEKF